jgi:hypothetical protein
MAKAYLIRGDQYLRIKTGDFTVDGPYPKTLSQGWAHLTGTGFETGVWSALDLGDGTLWLFQEDRYLEIDQTQLAVIRGPAPLSELDGFDATGFSSGIDAAVLWGDGVAYFFLGDSYLGFDVQSRTLVEDRTPIAGNWTGFVEAGFSDRISSGFNVDNTVAYFFRGDQCARYTIGEGIDPGYPVSIAQEFPAIAAAGDGRFAEAIDAAWAKLPPKLVPGDHVWYYDGRISTDQDIPRDDWFDPPYTGPTDYHDEGKNIYHFVVHEGGELYRGRPHMRNFEGTFAWLNNNPGNLTGRPGGLDLGQYPGKFNWHSFLVFPSYQAGYDAIADFLRRSGYPAKTTGSPQWPAGKYRDLGITQAFHRYAPADDGNDPEAYGAAVAAAAGVPATMPIADLTDEQMRLMQDKIVAIEGSRPGVVLSRDSADLPAAVRDALA